MTSEPQAEANGKLATAADLIADSVRIVDLANGKRVKIRRVAKDELMAKGLLPPVMSTPAPTGARGARQTDKEQEAYMWPAIVDAVLYLGLVEPRGYLGEPEKCPEGHVPVRWLGAHRDELFGLIYGASGYSEVSAAAASFRGEEGTRPDDSHPGEAIG